MVQVPSNLIPVAITQLPDAPVASGESLLLIVYEGNNYKIQASDLLQVSGVPTTRQVIAGTGMTGGGQLSSNVTLSVAPKAIDGSLLSDTGVTPGSYGSSTTVPVITVDATGRVTALSSTSVTVSGYVPVSRQIIAGDGLTGGGPLNADVTLSANLSDSTPLAGLSSGSAGASSSISRADHRHPAVDLADDNEVDGVLGLDNGGTARSIVPAAGAIVWSGADGLYVGPVGSSGQVLVSGGSGAPNWGSALVVSPQSAHYVFIGPESGGAADPAFRLLVNDDLPSALTGKTYNALSLTALSTGWKASGGTTAVEVSFLGGAAYSLSGTSGTVITLPATTGTLALNTQQFYLGTTQIAINRSSGALSLSGVSVSGTAGSLAGGTAGALAYQSTTDTTAFLSLGSSGYVLVAGASAPQYVAQSTLSVGSAVTSTSSSNLVGGAAGSVPYQTGAGATSFLGLGSQDYVLTAGATAPHYVAQSTLSVGSATTATSATTASNLAGGAAGSLPYQSGAGSTAFLALGTTNYVLTAGASTPQYVAQSTLSVGSATSATNASNVGVSDDTTTNATVYPVWVSAASGNVGAKVSSTRLSFNPSTGELTATGGLSGGTF